LTKERQKDSVRERERERERSQITERGIERKRKKDITQREIGKLNERSQSVSQGFIC